MLRAGGTPRLFINIVFGMLLLAFWGWCFTFVDGFARVSLVFCILCTLHGLVLAVRLIDLPAPVLSAGRSGLVFSNVITGHDLLEWTEIKHFRVHSIHYQFATIPWMSYLVVRSGRPSYFNGISRLLPTTWFGLYLLPTRMLAGGGKAARQMTGVIANLREADRHDAAHGGDREFMSDASLRWSMLRNVTFPVGKDGPAEEAMVGAVRDSLLEQAGVHRDLVPDDVRQQVLDSEAGQALAAKGDARGRQVAGQPRAEALVPEAAKQPPRHAFGRRGVLLNGEPLD